MEDQFKRRDYRDERIRKKRLRSVDELVKARRKKAEKRAKERKQREENNAGVQPPDFGDVTEGATPNE